MLLLLSSGGGTVGRLAAVFSLSVWVIVIPTCLLLVIFVLLVDLRRRPGPRQENRLEESEVLRFLESVASGVLLLLLVWVVLLLLSLGASPRLMVGNEGDTGEDRGGRGGTPPWEEVVRGGTTVLLLYVLLSLSSWCGLVVE